MPCGKKRKRHKIATLFIYTLFFFDAKSYFAIGKENPYLC